MHEPFSLLVPVYDGDRPDHIRRAMRSAVDDQTVRPDQVVIVRDGPVRDELARCLDELQRASPVPVTFVPLRHNAGLGPRSTRGWRRAGSMWSPAWTPTTWRCRTASRWSCRSWRTRTSSGPACSSSGTDTDDIVGQRVPPTDPGQIRRYARMHDPFNHPTVVYRRDAVLAAGGYGDLPLMEDYALFARMLQGGARAVNVAEPLVFYRVGAKAFRRRGGTGLLRSELRLQREFLQRGFISPAEYLRNVAVRGGYRLIPWGLRRAVYRTLVALYSKRPAPGPLPPGRPEPAEGERGQEWEYEPSSAAAFWRESASA